jgi:hypothetical protein
MQRSRDAWVCDAMAATGKSVRFAQVVKKAGAPTTYLLWSDPKKDASFQRALANHQLMTVHREMRGTHQDHGEIGYAPDTHAQYLLFPRSLRKFEGRRVVGINYDLLVHETTSGTTPIVAAPRKRERDADKKPKTQAAKPARADVVHFPAEHAASTRSASPKPPSREKTPKHSSASPPKSTSLDKVTAGEIRQAVNELKTGKYVAAYERLTALLRPR